MRRVLVPVVGGLFLALLSGLLTVALTGGPRASAHTSPSEAFPAVNERVSELTVLRLTFPTDLDPIGEHSLTLNTIEGDQLPVGETMQIDSRTIEAAVTEPLTEPGPYIVRYLVFELEEGPLSFADGGYQFFFDPNTGSSGTNWLAFGIFGAVLVVVGGLLARRRGLI